MASQIVTQHYGAKAKQLLAPSLPSRGKPVEKGATDLSDGAEQSEGGPVVWLAGHAPPTGLHW